jgi:Fe-S-cluster containining protein
MVANVLANAANVHEPILKDALNSFPYQAKEDGSCEMLVDDRCSVYENRPTICNIESMQKIYEKTQGISKEDYYTLNISICNALIKEQGLPQKYFIPHLGS